MPSRHAVFQSTCLSGPKSVGRPAVADTPVPLGPRNLDQSGSEGAASGRAHTIITRADATKSDLCMNVSQRRVAVHAVPSPPVTLPFIDVPFTCPV